MAAPAREHDEQEHQELQEEKPVLAQPLEGSIGLRLREKLLPEEGARDEFDDALPLEQVEQHHDRQCQREEERGGGEEVHRAPGLEVLSRTRAD